MNDKLDFYMNLAKEWNEINDDIDKIKFLQRHSRHIIVILDNDSAAVQFITDEIDDENFIEDIYAIDLQSFNGSFGNADGVFILFDALGIRADGC